MSGTTELEIAKRFMHEVYNLSFDKADSILNIYKKNSPDKSTLLMMRAYQAWWRILAGDQIAKNIELCKLYTDQVLSELKEEKKYDVNTALKYVSVYSLKSRLDNLSSKSLRSTAHFYNSIEHIKKLSRFEQKDDGIFFVLGMYIYSVEYIRKAYFFNLKLLPNPENINKEAAIEYIEKAALSENKIIKTEANYFLMKIYSELENRPYEAAVKIDKLTEMYPDNVIFRIEKIMLLYQTGKRNEAGIVKLDLSNKIRKNGRMSSEQKNHFLNLLKEIN